MASALRDSYRPSSVSPPGFTLADLLEERGISQAELATRTGRPTKTINEVIAGKASITAETALQLERALGVPAAFWLAREAQYRESRARTVEGDEFLDSAAWLKQLPIREMARLGWIVGTGSTADQVGECLRFFGVASVSAWKDQYSKPLAAFRRSLKFQTNAGAVAAWLRKGELDAAQINCKPFSRSGLRKALAKLRALTCEEDPEVFIPQLVKTCAACGVAVVFVPAPKGCPASGATHWVSKEKAILQLSLRYKANDQMWFTFFHEAAHILLHGKRILFLEGAGLEREEEEQADRFACDLLIPPEVVGRLHGLGVAELEVKNFARSIGIAPGIVVGRMQKEGLIPWSHLNNLKARYTWE